MNAIIEANVIAATQAIVTEGLPQSLLQIINAPSVPLVRAPLTFKKIRKMVLASFLASNARSEVKRFPYVFADTSFANVGFPDESAVTINNALRNGSRGLSETGDYLAWVESLPAGTPPTLRAFVQSVLREKGPLVQLVHAALNGLDKIDRNIEKA
jgi:hypothetical protein